MEFLERLEQHAGQLTNTEKKISQFVLSNRKETIRANIAELAKLSGTSRSAVLRFAQKLGYSGFSEFRYDFSIFVHAGQTARKESAGQIQLLASYYETAIKKIADYVSEKQLEEIAERISRAGRVKIFGLNRNSYSAQQLRHHLHTLNFDAEAVWDTVLVRDLSAAARPGDVHVYFSVNGATPIIREAIQSSAQQGADTVLVTMRQNSPMEPYATHLVLLPSTALVTTDYFLDQQAINFIFIEILIVYLGKALALEERKRQEE